MYPRPFGRGCFYSLDCHGRAAPPAMTRWSQYDSGHSNGQAAVYSYVPDSSVYCVFAGAYIIHEPYGDEDKHPYAYPADVYPSGHELFVIVICSASIAT